MNFIRSEKKTFMKTLSSALKPSKKHPLICIVRLFWIVHNTMGYWGQIIYSRKIIPEKTHSKEDLKINFSVLMASSQFWWLLHSTPESLDAIPLMRLISVQRFCNFLNIVFHSSKMNQKVYLLKKCGTIQTIALIYKNVVENLSIFREILLVVGQ